MVLSDVVRSVCVLGTLFLFVFLGFVGCMIDCF